ncbi:MAG: hypothetical protein GMKNLPBB_00820 [Myxococcota bacterium]|nr:hypothetical protein [Myxococcota bacterium]
MPTPIQHIERISLDGGMNELPGEADINQPCELINMEIRGGALVKRRGVRRFAGLDATQSPVALFTHEASAAERSLAAISGEGPNTLRLFAARNGGPFNGLPGPLASPVIIHSNDSTRPFQHVTVRQDGVPSVILTNGVDEPIAAAHYTEELNQALGLGFTGWLMARQPVQTPGGAAAPYLRSLPPARCVTLHQGCVVFAGLQNAEGPGRIIFSDVLRPAHYRAFAFYNLDLDGGDRVTGLASLGGALIVFTRDAIFRISGGHPLDEPGVITRLPGALGCASEHSIVEKDGALYFVSDEGFAVTDGFSARVISREIAETWRGRVNRGRISFITGAAEPASPRIWWGISTTSSTRNNAVICLDAEKRAYSILSGIPCDRIAAGEVNGENGELFFSGSGHIHSGVYRLHHLCEDLLGGDPVPVSAYIRTQLIDGGARRRKRFRGAAPIVEATGRQTLYVGWGLDGASEATAAPRFVFTSADHGLTLQDATREAGDNNLATFARFDALPAAQDGGMILIGSDTAFGGVEFVFSAGGWPPAHANTTVIDLKGGYRTPLGWAPLPNLRDGSSHNGAPLARSGIVEWELPGLWEPEVYGGVRAFWVQFYMLAALSAQVRPEEIRLHRIRRAITLAPDGAGVPGANLKLGVGGPEGFRLTPRTRIRARGTALSRAVGQEIQLTFETGATPQPLVLHGFGLRFQALAR